MDDKDKQIINTSVKRTGGSHYVLIPKRILDWINLENTVEVKILSEKGKHGRFLAIWNPNQQQEE